MAGKKPRRGKINSRLRKFMRLWEAQQGRCFYCEHPMSRDEYRSGKDIFSRELEREERGWTFDHVFPRSQGGPNSPVANGVLACAPCNFEKGSRIPTPGEMARAAEVRSSAFPLWTWPTGGSHDTE